jgi:hypothetical protein
MWVLSLHHNHSMIIVYSHYCHNDLIRIMRYFGTSMVCSEDDHFTPHNLMIFANKFLGDDGEHLFLTDKMAAWTAGVSRPRFYSGQ